MSANQHTCTACKRRPPFFFRPYSGQHLCEKCFVKAIERKVRVTIAKHKMFEPNDRVAVAVSGGKDSLTLLHILAKMQKLRQKVSLIAITVDEGIRGYRDEAMEIASAKCKELGIENHVFSFKELFNFTLDKIVAKSRQNEKNELTPCSYCGVLRRRALNLAARALGTSKIATGHTLDDEVQTILMNFLRGDVVRLAKEKPSTDDVHHKFVRKVKPFCEIPERETALYAYVREIRFQATPCPYASAAYRNDARSILNRMEDKYAGTKYTVFNLLERIRPALKTFELKKNYQECYECGEPASQGLCKVCELLKKMG